MKQKRIAVWLGGILLFFSVIVTFVWFLSPARPIEPKDLTFDEALALIKKKEVSEVLITTDSLELTDKNKNKFYTKLDTSNATRELIVGTIDEINKEKPGSVKVNLEARQTNLGLNFLINALPFLVFVLMWAITLGVIIWAVKTLTRNKS